MSQQQQQQPQQPPQSSQPQPQQSQYAPNGGGRGRGGGGRNNNNGGRGGVPAPGAFYGVPGRIGGGVWQPSAPPPPQFPGRGGGAPMYPPPPFYNPYYAPPPPGRGYPPPQQFLSGGVYYPPQVPQQQVVAPVQPPAPREKKPLTITDKHGNPIDFSASKKSTAPTVTPPPTEQPKLSAEAAGAKLREAALARLREQEEEKAKAEELARKEVEEKKRLEAEEKARKEAEEKAKKEAEDIAQKEAEEKAKREAAEKERKEAEEKAAEMARKEAEERERIEAEERAKLESEEKARLESAAKVQPPKSSLAALLSKPTAAPVSSKSGRFIYAKSELLSFKLLPECKIRPVGLPDMTITRGPAAAKDRRGGGGGVGSGGGGGGRRGSQSGTGGGGDSEWSRGATQPPRRQSSHGDRRPSGSQWERGHEMPRQQSQKGGRGGRGGRHQPPGFYDGPVEPLLKSENHWRPKKNTSALVVAEKKVKSILNKMTKETFDRLSAQMLEIPILSYEILTMMIDTVYDKAIDEPSFGDMYADLCVRLSQSVQGNKFVHIIESDEEPPTEDGEAAPDPNDESTQNTVYRWSNDVSTSDSEIVGPLPSVEACYDAAFDEEERTPTERGDLELELVSVSIKRGIFIKIMKRKDAKEDEDSYYTVYFPASEAKECGQQLSEIFLSEVECQADAAKKNTFKRSLLNKCEEEFNKQDIYEGWKKEWKEYEASKSKLTEAERAEKEEELNFRRIRIKKQMLGNVKFIGQLYKANLLKEKIMRYCISSLLKLEEIDTIKSKNPEYKDSGKTDMDEEDHEAICNMFTTIGSTIDKPHAADFMNVAFSKIERLSVSKDLPSRSRFMYKDLLELRANQWVPRRKEEKAKTIAEIRKDVELEERRQAQQSRAIGKGANDFRTSGRGTSGDYRARQSVTSSSRIRPKPVSQTDEDGFTVIGSSKPPSPVSKGTPSSPFKSSLGRSVDAAASGTKPMFSALADEAVSSKPDSLSTEDLEKKIKSMGTDFISNGENVEELLLSWEEISSTPDAGKILVMKIVDRLMDCKVNELSALIRIIIVLCEKAKLSRTDVQQGLMEAIEFIDSIAIDSPRVYEDFGFLLGDLLRIKMIEMSWLCEQLEKAKSADANSKAPEKVLRHALVSLKSSAGVDFARSLIQDIKLANLLDAATIDSISRTL